MGLAALQQRNVTNLSQQISATNWNTIVKMGFLVVLHHDAFSSGCWYYISATQLF
jgi:hypothetical protein